MADQPVTNSDYIITYTGRKFYPFAPNADDVDIRDIAHGLANTARFNGQTRSFYSVAEHSVHVSELCTNHLAGLLHDASEAYLHDLCSPLKYAPGFLRYRLAEKRLMEIISVKYGFAWPMPSDVYEADHVMLHTEARDLLTVAPDWLDYGVGLRHRVKPTGSSIRVEHEFSYTFSLLSR